MWLIAEYLATTLFSLKPAYATSSGGRTLLVPTPFAIKMALLDAICRTEGVASAEATWPWMRDRPTALRPAQQVVVNNAFTRILKPRRGEAEPGSEDAGPFQKTIGYREYAYLYGTFGIALWVDNEAQAERLTGWLAQINYLGKRGGFVQIVAPPQRVETLPDGFIAITREPGRIPNHSIIQQLDECGESLTFDKANIYTSERITLDKDRVMRHVALPYRVVASSRGYTWYGLATPEGG